MLDEKLIGVITNGEAKSFDIASGNHSLKLKFDWCGSNELDFSIAPNEIIKFKCGSAIKGWKWFFAHILNIFAPNSLMYIKREK